MVIWIIHIGLRNKKITLNEMPEILLINPKLENAKSFWLPLGLAYIASYLEKYSFKVGVIDANVLQLEAEGVASTIQEEPALVGISAMTGSIYSAWDIAKSIKKRFPKAIIVLGGHHPSVLPEESLKKEFVDVVVIGEGEETMKELATAIINKILDLDKIKGIAYKTGPNEIKCTQPRSLIENLDELPFPAWHLFPSLSKYISEAYKKLPVAYIFTSRGCPYRCTFCYSGIFSKRFRARSPENIISEVEYLKKNFGIKEFHILDDNFVLDEKRAAKFCNLLIERKINLPWAAVGGIRVNLVQRFPQLIELMAKSGCYRTAMGIESGNQQILNNIQKDITLEQVRGAVKILNKAGILVGGFFMIGNYGETEKTVEDTIKFAKSLSLDYAQFMIATPYPGSQLYEQVLKEGRFLIKDWREFNLWTGAVFQWNDLTKEQIDKMYRRAYFQYYFNPKFFLKSIANFKISSWKIYLKGFLILINNLLRFKTPMS
jgi:anaerobic magnesium-protoporphyrin IX monomethyl ester cyclase